MAYTVDFTIPKRNLGRADVEFDVKQDGSMLGTLTVSKGSLVWFPTGTIYGYRIGWHRFAQFMEESATSVERR